MPAREAVACIIACAYRQTVYLKGSKLGTSSWKPGTQGPTRGTGEGSQITSIDKVLRQHLVKLFVRYLL